MLRNWREIPSDLEVLLSGIDDVYAERGDTMPALYSLLSYMHVLSFRRRMNVGRSSPTDLVAAQFFDVLWDGEHRGVAA